MPFDFQWKPVTLPTREGVAIGKASENRMLDIAKGQNPIKKVYRTNVDGSVTTAHLQNGLVRFKTDLPVKKPEYIELDYSLRKWALQPTTSKYVVSATYTTELTLTTHQTIRFPELPTYEGDFYEYKTVALEIPTAEGLRAYMSVRAKVGTMYAVDGSLLGEVRFAGNNTASFQEETTAWDVSKCTLEGLICTLTVRTLPAKTVGITSDFGVSGELQLKPPSEASVVLDKPRVCPLDTVTRVGFARHGTVVQIGETRKSVLTNGTEIAAAPYGMTAGKQPMLVAFKDLPELDTTEAEATAGLTWQNYVLSSFGVPNPSALNLSNNLITGSLADNNDTGWLHRSSSGKLWYLKVEMGVQSFYGIDGVGIGGTTPMQLKTANTSIWDITVPLRVLARPYESTTYTEIFSASISIPCVELDSSPYVRVLYYVCGVSSPDGTKAVLSFFTSPLMSGTQLATTPPETSMRQYANGMPSYVVSGDPFVPVVEIKLTNDETPTVASCQSIASGSTEVYSDVTRLNSVMILTKQFIYDFVHGAGYTEGNNLYLIRMHESIAGAASLSKAYFLDYETNAVLQSTPTQYELASNGYRTVFRTTVSFTVDKLWSQVVANVTRYYASCYCAVSYGGAMEMSADCKSGRQQLDQYTRLPVMPMWHPFEHTFYLYDPDVLTSQVIGFF